VKDRPSAPNDSTVPAVELHGITKRFPGVVANKDIEITVRPGTVHAIVGENGAGKSTLMKILYGVQQPDEGTIAVNGQTLTLRSPTDAINAGIGMVFQHFMLADNLTVLENVVLGAEKLHGIGDEARRTIVEISNAYGLRVDPDDLVADLGVGKRQRIEILKVLYRGAKILILDEPTAVLVPQEVTELFDNLRELKAEGLTVIFISHKLDEVLSVADEITVIRRGTTVKANIDPETVNARQLAELMVGSELPSPQTQVYSVTDRVVLTIEHASLEGAGGGSRVLDDISLTIHAGEIVGIAGVEGNGQAELVEVVMGMREPSTGTITLDGEDITEWEVREIREAGVGYIPEDRHRHGMLLEAPLWENVILGHQTQKPNVSAGGLINAKAARAETERIVKDYDVRTPSIFVTGGSLSGGNQQKLIIGREMSHDPKVLLAAHPTRGVDVGAQAAIWDHIKRARRAGLAVLLISADLEELVGLSDNIRVMLRGRLSGDFDPDTVTREELGAAMTGADAPEPTSEDDLTPADPHTDTAEAEPRRDRTESGSGEVEPRRDRTESGSGEVEPRRDRTESGSGEVEPRRDRTESGSGEGEPR
jgi:simple sugar transport system ATP-binding protein